MSDAGEDGAARKEIGRGDGRPGDFPPPLLGLNGARPPAPAWFVQALANAPERSRFEVRGARIELLTWGERGRPGLLFLHGNGAHADWWSFIAPFFARTHRVAAISWSGMGGSDWRKTYAGDTFVEELFGALDAGGLCDGPEKPVAVGHSFGGFPLLVAAADPRSERLKAVITVDSPVRPPQTEWRGPPQRSKPNPVYPTLPAALDRFRLAPPQGCENPFIADHIARWGLKQAPLPDGSGEGWTWRFDPFMWREFRMDDRSEALSRVRVPVAVVWGERSNLLPPTIETYMRAQAPAGTPFVAIPDADHHVMIDQPLALVAALRALLEGWAARL